MMTKSIIMLSFFCTVSWSSAQEYRLYDGPAPGSEKWTHNEVDIFREGENKADLKVTNVVIPTITAYFPAKGKATGAAMIVCPGGGNRMLSWNSEGTNVAQWLSQHGIAAFILKYRLTYTGDNQNEVQQSIAAMFRPDASAEGIALKAKVDAKNKEMGNAYYGGDDGRRAIEYVRQHAAEWGIKPDKIGIMGFSAGAGVTLNVCFNHTEANKPNLVVPIYGSNNSTQVPSDAAPMFIVAPAFDLFGAPTGLNLFEMWYKANLPAELHYFSGSVHGFGLQPNGRPENKWIELLFYFMKTVKFIE